VNDSSGFSPPPGWVVDNNGGPYTELIGPIWRGPDGPDGIVKAIMVAPKHANLIGIAHGGILLSLMDNLMGSAISVAAPGSNYVTATLSSAFVSASRVGDWLEARASITKLGRTLVFIRATLSVGERTVMTGEASFARVPGPGPR
jgi:uncharacterized protein (TIGR00369 family)